MSEYERKLELALVQIQKFCELDIESVEGFRFLFEDLCTKDYLDSEIERVNFIIESVKGYDSEFAIINQIIQLIIDSFKDQGLV